MAKHIAVNLSPKEKRRLRQLSRESGKAQMRTRYMIVLLYDQGFGAESIAETLGCASSTASRVGRRFEALGLAGLVDGRSEPKATCVTDDHAALLCDLLDGSPRDHGWRRPTWTQELLQLALQEATGVPFSRASVARLLRKVGARKGRPRATVGCPWPKRKREARLAELGQTVESCPPDEAVVYEDEVDIHLNPKVGADWMLPGQQKRVLTPGQNEKRYLAGAVDARTGELFYVEGERKHSDLFAGLLRHLAETAYPAAKRIHIVLDNYGIHDSQRTRAALESHGGRIVLHFLPPYCPNANRIERLWNDLHDNVTRNHACETMEELMDEVRAYMRAASPFPGSKPSLERAS